MDSKILQIFKELQETSGDDDAEFLEFFKTLENKKKEKPKIKPTKLVISTQSAKCRLNQLIDRDMVAKFISDGIKSKMLDERIEGVKYKDIVMGSCAKNKKTGDFYNSMTIRVKIRENKTITLRIFKNGSITITGVKKKNDGKEAVQIFINSVLMSSKIKIKDYKITCMNSGYDIGFEIDPNNLYKTLIKNSSIFVSYTDNYDAVKVVYMYNKEPFAKDGVCHCFKDEEDKDKKCNGKGTGCGSKKCKKVTISIFRSGKILIIGGRLMKQLKMAYTHINKFLITHYHDIVRYSIKKSLINSPEETKKILSYFTKS